jgi:Anti-sigma-K factor rskA
MTVDTCPRIDDAGSYVLRAMPDGEWELYSAHLATCDVCAHKVAELGFVADALLNAVPQLTAPPVIRDRVMSVVRAESELLQASGAMADRPIKREPKRRFGLLTLRPWPATALASALLVLGIGGGALLVGGGENPRTIACAGAPRGATCRMRIAEDSAKLIVAGLATPPPGRIYQVWLKRGGTAPEPTEALFSVRKGRTSVNVPGELGGVKQVLVTDEPVGGSDVPTRQPIIAVPIA